MKVFKIPESNIRNPTALSMIRALSCHNKLTPNHPKTPIVLNHKSNI